MVCVAERLGRRQRSVRPLPQRVCCENCERLSSWHQTEGVNPMAQLCCDCKKFEALPQKKRCAKCEADHKNLLKFGFRTINGGYIPMNLPAAVADEDEDRTLVLPPHCLTPYPPVSDDRCIQAGCKSKPVTSIGKRMPLCQDHLDAVRQALALADRPS